MGKPVCIIMSLRGCRCFSSLKRYIALALAAITLHTMFYLSSTVSNKHINKCVGHTIFHVQGFNILYGVASAIINSNASDENE